MNINLRIGGLYYVYNPTYEEEAPVTICNILEYPNHQYDGPNREKPKILGRLAQKDPFIVLEFGPAISPYYVFHGEFRPLWVKILHKEIVGWIRIDSDRITEIR